jgi:hypothetical protein
MNTLELKQRTKTFALRIVADRKLSALLQEANDLTAIMAAPRKTARGA